MNRAAISVALLLCAFVAYATETRPPTAPSQAQQQAQGQHQGQHQGQEQSLAVDQANSQAVHVAGTRSVALGQGSVYIPECGAGGNAGGGDDGAVGFLGFAYVPAWCQDFLYAAFLISVGDHAGACAVMAASKPGKRAARKGIAPPQCSRPEPVKAPEPAPAVVEPCAAQERAERIFEKCVAEK